MRGALAAVNGPKTPRKWPQDAPEAAQGCPRVPQMKPLGDPKSAQNNSKTASDRKNLKTLKMTTLPHENHVFEGSKGAKINQKAFQERFESYKDT